MRARLNAICGELQADANAADRLVYFDITRGGLTLWRYPATGTFAARIASGVASYSLAPFSHEYDALGVTDRTGGLPKNLDLKAGDVLAYHTTNLQVGDRWIVDWDMRLSAQGSARMFDPAMVNWDAIPLAPEPTQPVAGAGFQYVVPAGRRGLLLGLSYKLVTVAAPPTTRSMHFTSGGTVFRPSDADNLAGQVWSKTCEYTLLPGVVQNNATSQAYQTMNLPRNGAEISADMSYPYIEVLKFNYAATDQLTVAWNYKEMKEWM